MKTTEELAAIMAELNTEELAVIAALSNESLTVDFVINMARKAMRRHAKSSLLGFVAGAQGFSTVAELAEFFWEDPELWMPVKNKGVEVR